MGKTHFLQISFALSSISPKGIGMSTLSLYDFRTVSLMSKRFKANAASICNNCLYSSTYENVLYIIENDCFHTQIVFKPLCMGQMWKKIVESQRRRHFSKASFQLGLHYFLCSVRFMSKCNRIFGDVIFTFCPIKLKLISITGRFWTNSGAKFHKNPTTGKECPHRPPL